MLNEPKGFEAIQRRHEHSMLHRRIAEMAVASRPVDATSGVVASSCAQQITDEPRQRILESDAASGPPPTLAPADLLLVMNDVVIDFVDQLFGRLCSRLAT
jgi:hypothetical protein